MDDWWGIAALAGVVVAVLGFWLLMRWLASASQRRAALKGRLRIERKQLDAHHTARYDTSPEVFSRDPLAWPLAAAAGFALCSEQPVDRMRDDDPASGAAMLRDWWGITTRTELLTQVWWLLVRGHRAEFDAERQRWIKLDPASAKQERRRAAGLPGDEGREMPVRLDRIRADERGIRGVDFTAWDLLRAIMLCRNGAAVGYLDERLAGDTMLLAANRLQQVYGSWEELGDHYERARWHWRGDAAMEDRIALQHDTHREAALLGPGQPRGLVPFGAPLLRSEVLIAGAMVAYDAERTDPIPGGWEQQLEARAAAIELEGA